LSLAEMVVQQLQGGFLDDEDGDVSFLISTLGAANCPLDLGPDLRAEDFQFSAGLLVL
jgi:hypothetical protein